MEFAFRCCAFTIPAGLFALFRFLDLLFLMHSVGLQKWLAVSVYSSRCAAAVEWLKVKIKSSDFKCTVCFDLVFSHGLLSSHLCCIVRWYFVIARCPWERNILFRQQHLAPSIANCKHAMSTTTYTNTCINPQKYIQTMYVYLSIMPLSLPAPVGCRWLSSLGRSKNLTEPTG
jgi:hypothetical protein